MAVDQGSTLYGGSVDTALIYEIDNGTGLAWAEHIKTVVNVDGKPRQLTKASHAGNPITENVNNPRRGTDFPVSDTVVIDGRELSVSALMVPDTWTTTDWLDTFPRFQPTGLAIDLQMNKEIQAVVFRRILNATHTQINDIHSNGDDTLVDPSPLRFYDGFVKQILVDVDATPVGVPAVLTAANIVSKVFELRNAIDPRLRNKPSLKIFSSYADSDLFDEAARLTQNDVTVNTLRGQKTITQANGSTINVIPIEGLPKDFMFATIADKSDMSNLVQGVWVAKDSDTLKLYREVEVDQTWNILMRFYAGVQYKTGEDIWYLNSV